MLRVGLTGGLACGKTFISEELARLGCHVIHADALGHEVLATHGEAYEPVVALFGPSILNEDGSIARPRVAELVFNDAEKLAALNAIVHPAVRRREEDLMRLIEASDRAAIVVVEAAILIEAGTFERFDCLVVAACSEDQQVERAMARVPPPSRQDIVARLSRQMPMSEKRAFADFVIDTSGTREETQRQTQTLYAFLRQNRKCV